MEKTRLQEEACSSCQGRLKTCGCSNYCPHCGLTGRSPLGKAARRVNELDDQIRALEAYMLQLREDRAAAFAAYLQQKEKKAWNRGEFEQHAAPLLEHPFKIIIIVVLNGNHKIDFDQ